MIVVVEEEGGDVGGGVGLPGDVGGVDGGLHRRQCGWRRWLRCERKKAKTREDGASVMRLTGRWNPRWVYEHWEDDIVQSRGLGRRLGGH